MKLPIAAPAVGSSWATDRINYLDRCWASCVFEWSEQRINRCSATATTDIGLCDDHYEELTGR